MIRSTPGLSLFAELPAGDAIRGWHVANSTLYAVSGQYLYSVTAGGTVTLLASISAGSNQVGMADNGNQLLIADGYKLWVYTLTSVSNTTWAPINTTFVDSTASYSTVSFAADPEFTPQTALEITAGTYTFRISIDGSAANLYSVAATGADTMSTMAGLIQQALSVTGSVVTVGSIVGGAPVTINDVVYDGTYLDGTYYKVPLTGGTGNGATATIVVDGNVVTEVTPFGGTGYTIGDVLSCSNVYLGGVGSGFNCTITATSGTGYNATVIAVDNTWVITSSTLGISSGVVFTIPSGSGTDLVTAINTAKSSTAYSVYTKGTSAFTSSTFKVTGDQTSVFTAEARLRLTENSGEVITTVTDSVYKAGDDDYTIVTVTTGSVDQELTDIELGSSPPIGTLVQVTSAAISQAMANGGNRVAYQDGFFLLGVPQTQQWYKSAQYDGMTWDALDYASKQSQPDLLQAIDSLNSTVVLWGDKSIEFWQNTGQSTFPFQRVNGATVNWGLAAVNSRAYSDNTMMFLGQNQQGSLQVVKLDGYTPVRISNHDLEHIITNMDVYADATAFSYILDGHIMYEITFPTANRSFLYDSLTKMWSEVQSGIGLKPKRHLPTLGINFNAANYVTDSKGKIYLLDQNNFTDNGEPIMRMITSRHVRMEGNDFSIDKIYLDMATGVGVNSGQGVNPQITMEVSNDYGNTWPVNRPTSMGAMGNYFDKVTWRRIGGSVDYVFRFTCTDPVQFLILCGSAVMRAGTQK